MTYRLLSFPSDILRLSFKCSPIGLRPRVADPGRLRRRNGPQQRPRLVW